MEKLQFPEPLTCQKARKLFPDLLFDKLGAEQQGRVQGHLLTCEQCSDAFAEAIDEALTRGDLPQVSVPPLTIPSAFKEPGRISDLSTSPNLFKEHPLFGVRWEEVREDIKYIVRTIQEIWQPPVPVLVRGERRTEPPPIRTRGGRVINADVIDPSGKPKGMEVQFEIKEGPCITGDGHFELVLHTGDLKRLRAQVICTLLLVDQKRVSFEGVVESGPSAQEGTVRFDVQGLPKRTVEIPPEAIKVFLVSSGH